MMYTRCFRFQSEFLKCLRQSLFTRLIRSIFLIVPVLLVLAASEPLQAQDFYFVHVPKPQNDKQTKHDAGLTTLIESSFNPTTQRFFWRITFAPAPGTGKLPDGLNLVVNTGFRPKLRQAEMAILFLDATSPADPKLTVYAFNGANTDTSWEKGSYFEMGPADRILSSLVRTDWIYELKVQDSPGQRIFTIDIKTNEINAHKPLFIGQQPWIGISYGLNIGIWSHTISGSTATYGPDGFLKSKSSGTSGYVDVERTQTGGCDGIVGSNTQYDPCGVCGGDGSSCKPIVENCTQRNTTELLFALDAGARLLKNVVDLGVKNLRLRPGTRLPGSSRNIMAHADKLFTAAWTNAWQLPQIVTACDAGTQCIQQSTTPLITSFQSKITDLSTLATSVLKKVSTKRGSRSRIVKVLTRRYNRALREVDVAVKAVPTSTFICS